MHEQTFANSFRPSKTTVLKLPMLTFSIGHELLLIGRSNPMLAYNLDSFKELSIVEKSRALIEAAIICYDDKNEKANALIENAKAWVKAASDVDLDSELTKFYAYRDEGSLDLPTVKQPRTQGVPYHYFGAPELARLVNYVAEFHELMLKTHFESSPLNFPLGLAKILYSTHLECQGQIWIENFHDIENKKRIEAFEKANPDAKIAVGEDEVRKSMEKWNLDHPEAAVTL